MAAVSPGGQFRLMFTAKEYGKSVEFYRDGLGLQLDHDWDEGPGDKGSVFKAGGGMVEVFAPAPEATYDPPRSVSMLIQVDDVDEWLRLASERGLTVAEGPVTQPYGQRTLRLRDPDGITVTLAAFL
jgi:catechol 2,3-dioxygenase-like lactoylglutathione lyase family enzyme